MGAIIIVATLLGGFTALWFIWERLFSEVEDKTVSNQWWDNSKLKQKYEEKGYVFRWCNEHKVEERLNLGYRILTKRVWLRKYRFKNTSNQILMGKPKS